jgi:hypothetical protein
MDKKKPLDILRDSYIKQIKDISDNLAETTTREQLERYIRDIRDLEVDILQVDQAKTIIEKYV